MGLFGKRETSEEVKERVYNSECGKRIAHFICSYFDEGSEQLRWLMTNSGERMYKIEFYKDGIVFKQIEVSQRRLKETGTYDVAGERLIFGELGYEDLPNSKYVYAVRQLVYETIKEHCQKIKIQDDYIKLAEGVKKGW